MNAEVKLIGTSHISSSSVREVENVIASFSPNFVCVELDKRRAQALMQGATPRVLPLRFVKQLGVAGYLFSVIGALIQRKLGHIVGTSPGVDMKAAVVAGGRSGARVVLIDRDISVTLKRFSQLFSFRERMRFFFDLIFPWRVSRQKLSFNLHDVPSSDVIASVLSVFALRYPGMYKALITERNAFMVSRILHIAKTFPASRIAVFVGAGHLEGMRTLLEKSDEITLVR